MLFRQPHTLDAREPVNIALDMVHPVIAEQLGFGQCLGPLADCLDIHAMRQSLQCFDEQVVMLGIDIADKGFIDFHQVDLQVFQL